jgi:hypothetical protein
MKKRSLFILGIVPTFLFAQVKPEIVSGSADAIKGATKMNVVFDFTDCKYYEENMSEEAYIKRRKDEVREKHGDAEVEVWYKDWLDTRSNKIPNLFISNLSKYVKNIDFTMNDTEAKYTMTIKVSWIYPGYFAVAMNQPAKATSTLTFTENSNPTKALFVMKYEKTRGIVGPFGPAPNTNTRIADAFNALGIYLGKYLKKALK